MTDAKQLVNSYISNPSNKVLIFSKTTCPYCKRAKATLESALQGSGVGLSTVEVDTFPPQETQAIQAVLGEITGKTTVPRVFVGGEFVGGGDDVEQMAQTGELQKLLAAKKIIASAA